MFSDIIKQYITHGTEETYLEFKGPMKWAKRVGITADKIAKIKIIKAMMAMSNNPNGGVIVVGVKQRKNGEFLPVGVGRSIYDSYQYDFISRELRNYCDPQIQFTLTRDEMEINGRSKRFVVLQVTESKNAPVICIKGEVCNPSSPATGHNILLRENAIYIRSKSPIESREIASVNEWKELIERLMEKNEAELLKRLPCSKYLIKQPVEKTVAKEPGKPEEAKKFDSQLKGDKL